LAERAVPGSHRAADCPESGGGGELMRLDQGNSDGQYRLVSSRTASAFVFICLLTVQFAFAADLRVPNRAPKPDEVGYRPADRSESKLNPPSFIWLHEPSAATYSVQWSKERDFSEATTITNFAWNTYTHNQPLPAGDYWWRYQFQTTNGEASDWSVARSVVVPRGATAFPMPTRAEQRSRVPANHPRLFMRPEDLPKLRALTRGRAEGLFKELKTEADRILKAGPTPEPAHLGSARNKNDKEMVKYWWPNRTQTEKACMEAETLAFVYLLTGDRKYGEAARRWVLHLASWNPDGPTNFRLNCEAGKPMLFRPARAYDWAWDMFTAEDRKTIQAITLRRLQDAWTSGEVGGGVGHLNRPFNSHGNRVWHKIGEAGIAFLGEIPEAETWLDYAVNKFYSCYPIWADDDGGWHEGVSYWSGYMGKAVWWLQVAHSALQIDGLKKPFFAHVGDYPLYIAPPNSPNSGFGDLSFSPPSRRVGAFMDYHIRMRGSQADGSQAAYWRWWTGQWRMEHPGGIMGFLYTANLPPLPAARAPGDLPVSKVFRGIGVASLHTTLLDARDDVHFLFKSSPFGTQSHGHNPHNSYQLNAYGEALLTTCVYRDLHGSRFHYEWAHSTRAHNAVLVNGEGQIKHTAAPHGKISDYRFTPQYDYVAGDAAPAYGDRLKRFRRQVAFVKGLRPVLVIYDDLAATQPSTFQFMLHGFKPFSVDEAARAVKLEQTRAGVVARYLSPVALGFRQWSGFDPPPNKEFPEQWHVEAGTLEKREEMGMLTVLVPYRKGQPPREFTAERVESETATGVKLRFGRVSRTIAFRKHGTTGEAEIAGARFSGPVGVW
jgi:hypothetical protein